MAIKETKLPKLDEEIDPSLWINACSIYKVPNNIREENKDAYTPRFISIGPIHHNETALEPMEKEKRRYYCEFFKTRQSIDREEKFERLKVIEVLSENEAKIRQCYSEKYDVSDCFLNMILLDAVFIIELFWRNWNKDQCNQDYLFAKPYIRHGIQRDLSLLENQLPFFILDKLFDKFFGQLQFPRFLHLAHEYFKDIDPSNLCLVNEAIPRLLLQRRKDFEHFTDLIRCYYIPEKFAIQSNNTHGDLICATNGTMAKDDQISDRILKSATKLNAAGVTFTQNEKKFLLDLDFDKKDFLNWLPCLSCLPYINCVKSRFKIPQLTVDDGTECILRNLIAFEQCHYPSEAFICCYVLLLDYLVDSKEDVELLVEEKVIVNELGSNEEAASFFNKLAKEVTINSHEDCYRDLIKKLNGHYESKWNRNMAKLRSVYFCDPWRGSSTVVGIAILFFTFFNFFTTIF